MEMNKFKKILSIFIFIVAIFIYSLLVMVFLSKINFNNWFIEFIIYFIAGTVWIIPSIYILKPFKKNYE